jgi:trehalose 6-phosphate synthase/phosphatase
MSDAQRLILVSNRLPVSIDRKKSELTFKMSMGGVATGLGAYHETHESLWVGWADVPGKLTVDLADEVSDRLRSEHGCVPVFLTGADVRGFYYGFSNRTLWPLFHHFNQYAEFDPATFASYEEVNRKYCDAVMEVARSGDIIWVQDYQLLLLPGMLRQRMPDATIGFFLHIPFPSFEIFRMLPWREQLLEGLLGSDLIGFHTYDYVRYFLGSARRLLGVEEQHGRVTVDDRLVLVDAFPMGIDYDKYAGGVASETAVEEAAIIRERTRDRKLILGIDRLDYSKGIPERLRAFDKFLEKYPDWRGKVVMIAVAVPSRERVDHYKELKSEVDELVGYINGKYSTMDWTPIRYHYRALQFEKLSGTYAASDICLVTPLRDGMNLIAKEYVAGRLDQTGVLVLSEMAGAARELGEAVMVNPFDQDAMVDAIREALEMPGEEQRERNEAMQRRIKRYTVRRWAEDFLQSLEAIKLTQVGQGAHLLDEWARERLVNEYSSAEKRLIISDYDGTLMPLVAKPEASRPDPDLLGLLERLSADERNEIVIVSGRERGTLDSWLGHLPIELVAEHGVWLKDRSGEWVTIEPMSAEWKDRVRPIIEVHVDRTPGTFIEERDFSLVWHYGSVHPNLAAMRSDELMESLLGIVSDMGLALSEGYKKLEVRAAGISKARAAHRWLAREEHDFALYAGDDRGDEDVFETAPEQTWTIKVGRGTTAASHSVRSVYAIRDLIEKMLEA